MSMKNEIAVGIFFFIGMFILGYFTIIMSGEIFQSHEYYEMSVVFPNVEGLGKSDKVKINGVLSGTVEEVQLQGNLVWVKLKMFNRFTLYENYIIKIKNETTLGGKYVGIYPGTALHESKQMAVIDSRMNLRGEAVSDPFEMISKVLDENREAVRSTINNLKEITGKINSGKGTLGKLVNQDKIHDSTGDLIKELRDVIEDTREQAPVTSFIRAALMAF